ncbi:hypothetical protein AMJ44_02905 [candidate division WOR-1 bacterium DG_54_3]|uniref:Uncharacterized protein n=1 Tax=candidate division WOR-1 bacterium DG_54_3 TaxID=1703775 RepID=A0A0S7Y4P0_UNCSA|nr:MAG: hypothetical protein AMJ44_02905 [candidate division WOR-1 bacterium DG_54_3]
MNSQWITRVFLVFELFWGAGLLAEAAQSNDSLYLQNEKIKAEFNSRGLVSSYDIALDKTVRFTNDNFSITVDEQKIDSETLSAAVVKDQPYQLSYNFEAAPYLVKAVYELKPGWRFISKQLFLSRADGADYRVNEVEVFRAGLANQIFNEHRLRGGSYGALLRLADEDAAKSNKPRYGIFLVIQNPFMRWKLEEQEISMVYRPDMDWKSEYGHFASDRACIGTYELSGTCFPARALPEWKYVCQPEKFGADGPMLDMAEIDAITQCVRAFVLIHPKKSLRVHVPWCENDYQIDVGTAKGVEEYKRIIDQAADLGCEYLLYTPGNSKLSSIKDNTDAWGWENILWLGLGQKIRKDQWQPEKDAVPACLQEMLDYAKAKDIRFMAYVYPSLGFMQNPEWTKWAGDKVGGYLGADTGVRSFQDWLVEKLVAFHKRTGAGGYSFDYWWLGYDNASSKYAQWYGCRRILENLRKQIPDIVIDGRQSYHWFGPWTWLAGSYPHPTASDEQPGSFVAFPDLHTDRISANRQRFTAWWYRMEQFCPPEVMPGFITHQTHRVDAKGVYRRDRFRPRDWDYLAWKYSLISSIATAPFNHVVDMIPARDMDEFKNFPEQDKKWFRHWLNWTDKNIEYMYHIRPIIGQPMVGRVDGSSAIVNNRGFVFLFNPNYRKLNAEFTLDKSIGLKTGKNFVLEELYPQPGKLIGHTSKAIWNYGDKVALPMGGAQTVVLEINAAPKVITELILFNCPGKATIKSNRLELTGVSGEIGSGADLLVLVPKNQKVETVSVNGNKVDFTQNGDVVSAKIRFAGTYFGQCQQIGSYDPNFTGGTFKGTFEIPARIFKQLQQRKEKWPIPYTEDDLLAPWLGSWRLLLFVCIAEQNDKMDVNMKINGQPIEVKKAYNAVYPQAVERTYIGSYADISSLKPDTQYQIEVTLPELRQGQFQGLFFENIEAQYTQEIVF